MVKWWFSMALAVLMLCPAACCWAGGRVMEISIDEIFRAFDADPQAAERKFRGETLRISGGIARSLRIDSLNHHLPTLTLESGSGGTSRNYRPRYISYHFSRHQYNDIVDAVEKMVRGESVTVTCKPAKKPGLKGLGTTEPGTCLGLWATGKLP